jgi:hypothetical protein
LDALGDGHLGAKHVGGAGNAIKEFVQPHRQFPVKFEQVRSLVDVDWLEEVKVLGTAGGDCLDQPHDHVLAVLLLPEVLEQAAENVHLAVA